MTRFISMWYGTVPVDHKGYAYSELAHKIEVEHYVTKINWHKRITDAPIDVKIHERNQLHNAIARLGKRCPTKFKQTIKLFA